MSLTAAIDIVETVSVFAHGLVRRGSGPHLHFLQSDRPVCDAHVVRHRGELRFRCLGQGLGREPQRHAALHAYRWEPAVRRWGVMAQEAPDRARIVMPSGFLAVDYRALAQAAL